MIKPRLPFLLILVARVRSDRRWGGDGQPRMAWLGSDGGGGLGPARGWGQRVHMSHVHRRLGAERDSSKLPHQSVPPPKGRFEQPPGLGVRAIVDIPCHLQ